MVRINLINPKNLADQHLIAEYNEILMLFGYVEKHPFLEDLPKNYVLGKGHIKFFKNKLLYLKERHEKIKNEMIKRGFNPTKSVDLADFEKDMVKNWEPSKKDIQIIKTRLIEKISLKPEYYNYYGKKRIKSFFIKKINQS